MAEKPEFLGDQPVAVRIDSLHSFAKAIQAELDINVLPNVRILRAQLGASSSAYTAKSFGVDPDYAQGYRIGDYHIECVEKAGALLDNLALGLQAIAYAAHNIANDFEDTDALNDMDLNRVDGYFHPTDRSRSLAERGLPGLPGDNDPPTT